MFLLKNNMMGITSDQKAMKRTSRGAECVQRAVSRLKRRSPSHFESHLGVALLKRAQPPSKK
jgi:hypothetical protein